MGCQAPRMFLNILSPPCPPPGTSTWTLIRINEKMDYINLHHNGIFSMAKILGQSKTQKPTG